MLYDSKIKMSSASWTSGTNCRKWSLKRHLSTSSRIDSIDTGKIWTSTTDRLRCPSSTRTSKTDAWYNRVLRPPTKRRQVCGNAYRQSIYVTKWRQSWQLSLASMPQCVKQLRHWLHAAAAAYLNKNRCHVPMTHRKRPPGSRISECMVHEKCR